MRRLVSRQKRFNDAIKSDASVQPVPQSIYKVSVASFTSEDEQGGNGAETAFIGRNYGQTVPPEHPVGGTRRLTRKQAAAEISPIPTVSYEEPVFDTVDDQSSIRDRRLDDSVFHSTDADPDAFVTSSRIPNILRLVQAVDRYPQYFTPDAVPTAEQRETIDKLHFNGVGPFLLSDILGYEVGGPKI